MNPLELVNALIAIAGHPAIDINGQRDWEWEAESMRKIAQEALDAIEARS